MSLCAKPVHPDVTEISVALFKVQQSLVPNMLLTPLCPLLHVQDFTYNLQRSFVIKKENKQAVRARSEHLPPSSELRPVSVVFVFV